MGIEPLRTKNKVRNKKLNKFTEALNLDKKASHKLAFSAYKFHMDGSAVFFLFYLKYLNVFNYLKVFFVTYGYASLSTV